MLDQLTHDAMLLRSPLAGLAKEYKHGHIVPIHQHGRAQLLYATRGVMRVKTDKGTCTVPPLRALWIPSATPHEVLMVGNVSMRTMYVGGDTPQSLWPDCCVVRVTPLLRELILNALAGPAEYAADSKADLTVQLLLLELKRSQVVDTKLPIPQDRRLRMLTDILIKDPGNGETLEMLGERVGACARTLSRLFMEETGMTFSHWRQQLRLSEAICRLSLGDTVATIAHDLGYDSQSAFIAMFKRVLGESPARYWTEVRRHGAGPDGIRYPEPHVADNRLRDQGTA